MSKSVWDSVEGEVDQVVYPTLSLILPTFNSAATIGLTLESIRAQQYPSLEVLVLDAGSTDRTVDIVRSYYPLVSRVLTVDSYNRFEMYNRGTTIAEGRYLNFFFPGSFFLAAHGLKMLGRLAVEQREPELIYGGSAIRSPEEEFTIKRGILSVKILKQGDTPTMLLTCLFRKDALVALGKFNTGYRHRAGLDLFCRFERRGDFRSAHTLRVLTEYKAPRLSYRDLMVNTREIFSILSIYYGFTQALGWWLSQNHLLMMHWWWNRLKNALLGPR